MGSIKKWLQPKQNRVIAAVIACVIVFGGGYGLWSIFANKIETIDPFTVETAFEYNTTQLTEEAIRNEIRLFDDNNIPIDYVFIDFDATKFDVSKVSYKLTSKQLEELNNLKTDHEAWKLYAFSNSSKAVEVPLKIKGKDFVGTVTVAYVVVDTQAPILENPTKDITLETNKAFNPVYSKAKDVVDGEVDVTWEGSFDLNVPGVYMVKEVAEDKNGNQTINEFTITVVEAKQETSPSDEVDTTDSGDWGYDDSDSSFGSEPPNGNGSTSGSESSTNNGLSNDGSMNVKDSGGGDLGPTVEEGCESNGFQTECWGTGTPPWEIAE